jgi:hypothetical protein
VRLAADGERGEFSRRRAQWSRWLLYQNIDVIEMVMQRCGFDSICVSCVERAHESTGLFSSARVCRLHFTWQKSVFEIDRAPCVWDVNVRFPDEVADAALFAGELFFALLHALAKPVVHF